jgi:hypothetical protein
MDRPLGQGVPRHRKIFVNGFEQTTDVLLREVVGRHGARVSRRFESPMCWRLPTAV